MRENVGADFGHNVLGQSLIDRARNGLAEIEQIRIDVDHWNRCVRKPHEPELDWDPEGKMRRLRDFYQAAIVNIANDRRIPPPDPDLFVPEVSP